MLIWMIYDYAFWAVFLQMSIIAPTALGIFPLCAFWTKIQSVFPRKINECKYPGGKRKDLSVRTQIRSFSSSKHKKVRMSINPSENCFEQIKTCCCWIIYILIWITVLQYYCIRSVYIIHYTYVCVCVCVWVLNQYGNMCSTTAETWRNEHFLSACMPLASLR